MARSPIPAELKPEQVTAITLRNGETVSAAILSFAPGYAVSQCGTLFSRMKPGCGSGYRQAWREIRLARNGGRKRNYLIARICGHGLFYVHHLVLLAFVGPRPNGMQVRHINGNPLDNRLENLAYGLPIENARDIKQHGNARVGERNGRAKLTLDAVRAIRSLHANGSSAKDVANRVGVTRRTVADIISGQRWGEVQ